MPTSRQLRDRVGRLPIRRRTVQVWRAVRPGYDLLSTRGARLHGGRWNPPGVPALYTSIEPITVRAEWLRATERRGLPESAAYPLRLGLLSLRARTVDLRSRGALTSLDVEEPPTILTPLAATRAVGAAAEKAGVEALLVPSVTGVGSNFVIFAGNLESEIEVLEASTLRGPGSWP